MTIRHYYPLGPLMKPVWPLRVEEFEKFQGYALGNASPEEIRRALETLVPRLQDEIVEVERADLFEPGSSRVTIFRHPTLEPLSCFVLVSGKGEVLVGRTDDLHHPSRMRLETFDTIQDEVLSVAVTDRLRPMGTSLDLFIVTRSLEISEGGKPNPEPRAYHGLIRFEKDRPVLALPVDDMPDGSRSWHSRSAERLPAILKSGRSYFAPEVDPFDLPPEITRQLDQSGSQTDSSGNDEDPFDLPSGVARRRDHSTSQDDLVAMSGRALCRSSGTTVCLETASGRRYLDSGQEVAYLSTTSNSNGKVFGIFGFDSRKMVAFEAAPNDTAPTLEATWHHHLSSFPSCVAFLPCEGQPWPDLLVSFRGGGLARLHYVRLEILWDLWDRLWQDYGAQDADQKLRLAQRLERTKDSSTWRRTLLFGAIERMLQQLAGSSEEDQRRWLEIVPELFRPDEDYRVLSVALQPLLATLRRIVRGESTNGKAFLLEMLSGIYQQQDRANIEILSQIDRVVRSVEPEVWEGLRDRPNLRKLIDRSLRNRHEIWQGLSGPKPSINDQVERCAFGPERWASAYLTSDAVHFGRWQANLSVWDAEGFSTGPDRHWLAVTSKRGLSIHQWDHVGRIELVATALLELESDLENNRESRVLTVPGPEVRLLFAEGANLKLLRFDPAGSHIETMANLLVDAGSLGPWSFVPDGDGGGLGIVACHRGRRSTWLVFRVHGDRLEVVRERLDPLPKVSCLDLAQKSDGTFIFLTGSSLGGPVHLYSLHPGGELKRIDSYWPVAGGALTVCFDRQNDPKHGIIGDVGGFIWCAQIPPVQGPIRLGWVYKLDAAIRSVTRSTHQGQPHVLIGSDAGKLAFLRCSDAARVWTHRLQSPVRRLSVAADRNHDLIVILRAGWLATFEHLQDEDGVFATIEDDLRMLGQYTRHTGQNPFSNRPDQDTAQAILGLLHGETLKELLEKTPGREHRARILRFATRKAPGKIRQQCREVLPDLSFRELQLLLCYTPADVDIFEQDIRQELETRIEAESYTPPPGDDSLGSAYTAWVFLLQRLDRRQVSLTELMQNRPRHGVWYESLWLRLELARLFIRTLHRELTPAGDTDPRVAALLSHALPHLLRFPPRMIESCHDVLPNNSKDHQLFSSFSKIVVSLQQGNPLRNKYTRRVIKAFEAHPTSSPVTSLVRSWLQLVVAWTDFQFHRKEETWEEHRKIVLDAVRDLSRKVFADEAIRPKETYQLVIRHLRSFLPPKHIPEDTAQHQDREGWLHIARDTLKSPGLEPNEQDKENPWLGAVRGGLDIVRRGLLDTVEREEEHLREEIRPFLRLRSPLLIQDNNEVVLELQAQPEGRRWLEDAQVRIDAGIPDGLRSNKEDDISILLQFPRFQPGNEGQGIELRGFVAPGTQEVHVQTILETGDDYRHRQTWTFAISRHKPGLPGHAIPFQQIFDHVFHELDQAAAPVVLLVIDTNLGRDTLAGHWRRETGGRQVDLDRELASFGTGGRYSERKLDLSLVLETLTLDDNARQPVLITSMDQVVQRWLDGEAPGALEAWLRWLQTYVREERNPRLVWVATSSHAAAIRATGLDPILEVRAHRPLDPELLSYDGHALRRTPFWESLVEAGAKILFAGDRVARRDKVWQFFQELGGDLHLVAHWLAWASESSDQARQGLRTFFTKQAVERRIATDLGSLTSLDLLNALVGATTQATLPFSRIVPGLIAAEEFRSSTTKQAPKLLLVAGSPFTQRIIASLKADARPPVHVKVQGFGTVGTFETEEGRSRLLELAKRRPREERQASFLRLTALGIGTWHHGIFRTTEPYRGRIRGLYDQAANIALEERDGKVYEAILGSGRTPLENLSLVDLADVSAKELQPLIPEAQTGELRLLQRLARQWRGDGDDAELLPIFRTLYNDRLVWQPERTADRWDRSLLDLPYRLFGVGRFEDESQGGQSYPIGYHFWLELGTTFDSRLLARAIERTVERRQQHWRELRDTLLMPSEWTPRIILTGPGCERIEHDPDRRFAVLKSADILRAAWEGDLAESLLRGARVQMRLTSISPFQTSGPIPQGSKHFFGRGAELTFIKTRLRKSSFLVVGSRRVGKTSLLNQIRTLARKEPDLEPIFVDLQQAHDKKAFLQAVRVGIADPENPEEVRTLADEKFSFEEIAREVGKRSGRLPVRCSTKSMVCRSTLQGFSKGGGLSRKTAKPASS